VRVWLLGLACQSVIGIGEPDLFGHFEKAELRQRDHLKLTCQASRFVYTPTLVCLLADNLRDKGRSRFFITYIFLFITSFLLPYSFSLPFYFFFLLLFFSILFSFLP
jgi:hypothetical protein